MRVFHHNDADGVFAAACIANMHPDGPSATYWKVDYETPIDPYVERIAIGEEVWIVDFSLSISTMRRLLERTTNVVWIDHHKTAIEKCANQDNVLHTIGGVRDTSEAACILTYEHLRSSATEVWHNTLPGLALLLVADYDMWTFAHGELTHNFHAGIQSSVDRLPPTALIFRDLLLSSFTEADLDSECGGVLDDILTAGAAIREFEDTRNESLIKQYGHEIKLDGKRGFALNVMGNSTLFGSLIDKYDFVMSYVFNGREGIWRIRLYSRPGGIDVSEMAKRRERGGGHTHAAGFEYEPECCGECSGNMPFFPQSDIPGRHISGLWTHERAL